MLDYSYIESYKGVHPGKVLQRELARRRMKQNSFAACVSEHPQTINAVISGRRDMNLSLALRSESVLGLPEGFFMILQVFYDISKSKTSNSVHSAPPNVRRVLFWDSDFDTIDWDKYQDYVIDRVQSRGNDDEKKEIMRYYGRG